LTSALRHTCHLLVGGTTGSGKSVCLHALLLSLLWRLAPQDLQLTLIDPKRVELAQYAAFPQVAGGEVVEDIGDALEILQQLVDEMERRTLLLRQHEVANLSEGRAQGGIDLPYVVVVVEELADLLFQSREAEAPLVRLAQKARAPGPEGASGRHPSRTRHTAPRRGHVQWSSAY